MGRDTLYNGGDKICILKTTNNEFLAKAANIMTGLESLSERLTKLEAFETGESLAKPATELREEIERLCKL